MDFTKCKLLLNTTAAPYDFQKNKYSNSQNVITKKKKTTHYCNVSKHNKCTINLQRRKNFHCLTLLSN